ncbi:MAG: Uma2 family endonuclease [Acidimicrobiales bacterium]
MSVEPVRHLFTVEKYERMGEAGLFDERSRVELLGGEIIEMSPIGRGHAACVNRLTAVLTATLGDRFVVAVQNPLRLDDLSETQPDVVVLKPREDFYAAFHPRPEDTLLVIEVAETSLAWDRGTKRTRYAAAGVVEVWIVDLGAVTVEVATEPGPGGYARVLRRGRDETIEASAVPGLALIGAAITG